MKNFKQLLLFFFTSGSLGILIKSSSFQEFNKEWEVFLVSGTIGVIIMILFLMVENLLTKPQVKEGPFKDLSDK